MTVFDTKNGDIERHWPQILAILIGSIAGLTDGLLFSWTSPFVVKITQDKENYDITEEEASYFSTIQSFAMLVTAPFFSVLMDKWGRKKTFLIIAVTHSLSWLFSAFARNVIAFYTARVFAGISNACFFCIFPVYVGETANPTVRGVWGNMTATAIYVGQFLINIIGSYFDIKQTSYICITLPITFFILFAMMPESPYWYIMKGKEEEAKKSLTFLKRKANIDSDYKQLKLDVERQLSETGTWKDVFAIKSNKRGLLAGCFLRLAQLMSGLQMFFIYTQFIFQKSGGNIGHELASIIYTAISVTLNCIVLIFVVNKFARRTLFVASLLSTSILLFLLATYFYLDENVDIDLTLVRWLPLAGMIIYQICASIGISIIPSLMMSELFSASIKLKAMMLLVMQYAAGNLLTNLIFYYLNSFVGFYAPFYLFAACNIISIILSFYLIPETKGKTLEEIQQILKKK